MSLDSVSISAVDAENYARHRWYFFKEAFSPALVKHAVGEAAVAEGIVVVDPFSGSGTTVLTASLAGLRSYGIEVNPFLRFVAETKSTQVGSRKFLNRVGSAISALNCRSKHRLEAFSTFSEKAPKAVERGKWLFNSAVLRAFGGAWDATAKFEVPERNLVRLCLIGAAMDVANAYKDGKCLRYKQDWRDRNYGRNDFREALEARAAVVAEDLKETSSLRIAPRVQLGDCRTSSFPAHFDVCVTSPPYLNSFDYTDVYRPELFLGEFIGDMEALRKLRGKTLRSHVQTSWSCPTGADFGSYYLEIMNELLKRVDGLWDVRLPAMVQAYFEDMSLVLTRLRSRANRGAVVYLVVSTSAYAGVEIPVDLIIADVASKCGWFLREIVVARHLRRVSGQQWHELNSRPDALGPHLRESVVVLDAQAER